MYKMNVLHQSNIRRMVAFLAGEQARIGQVLVYSKFWCFTTLAVAYVMRKKSIVGGTKLISRRLLHKKKCTVYDGGCAGCTTESSVDGRDAGVLFRSHEASFFNRPHAPSTLLSLALFVSGACRAGWV